MGQREAVRSQEFSLSESLAIEKMASRRRLVSIALVIVIVGGGFLYGYEGTVRLTDPKNRVNTLLLRVQGVVEDEGD